MRVHNLWEFVCGAGACANVCCCALVAISFCCFLPCQLDTPCLPPHGPLQIARVRNQLEYERRSSAELAEAIAAKEGEVEREQAALEKRQEEEKQYAKDNEAVQVGVCSKLGQDAGVGGDATPGWCGCASVLGAGMPLAAAGRQAGRPSL